LTDGAASAPFSYVARERLGILTMGETGRFAPSPTGPLHLGSLLAAVGSYLDARVHGARWLVRIEDLDTARVIPGCAEQMLRTLEAFGFEWDGAVLFQSTRRAAHREALAELACAQRTFRCSCSRKDLAGAASDEGAGYPGTCREGLNRPGPTCVRFRVSDTPVLFNDLFLGKQHFELKRCGDVIIERRDGIASYQLAVVVDDAFQKVTRVVRGADLLTSTPWQIDLQSALGASQPIYGHLPLLLEPDGTKLSKANHAVPLDLSAAPQGLTSTLTLLSQAPPPELAYSSIKDVWNWAVANWNPETLAGRSEALLSA
jgi:glutamyl-Q tRNA(Asp) synthetase